MLEQLRYILIVYFSIMLTVAHAQHQRDRSKPITSPAFFGPNALPVPEVRNGIGYRSLTFESELKHHFSSGDQTTDFSLQSGFPLIKELLSIEVSMVLFEYFEMDSATHAYRECWEPNLSGTAKGDLKMALLFNFINDSVHMHSLGASANFSFPSGNQIGSKRFADVPIFYFAMEGSKGMNWNKSRLLFTANAGAHFTHTNHFDPELRTNEAFFFGGKVGWDNHYLFVESEISGYLGNQNNGDRPIVWRLNLSRKIKNHKVSLLFQMGIQHWNYNTIGIQWAYQK